MFGGGGVGGGGGNGLPGAPGKSAYQVALDNGFVGTQSEWLATLDGVNGDPGPKGDPGEVGPIGDPGPKGLDGEDAYHLAVDNGFAGTLVDWFASIKGDKGDKGDPGDTGPDGLSAYQIAVAGGFNGTQDVWLTTLKGADGAQGPRGFQGDQGNTGAPGADGASAYAIALDNGFVGTQAEWLLSIHGADGAPGSQGEVGPQGPAGAPGTNGLNGKSAYELATTGGYSGTQDEWLTSLHGADGAQGPKGDTGAPGSNGADGESAYQLAIGDGYVGSLPNWLASLHGADGAQGPQGIQGEQGFQGPQGTPGINGNSVLNGSGAPAAGVGNDGDFYINKTTNVIYGPRAAGAWPSGGTALVGPQGPQGNQGVQGTAGTNGNTLLNGLGAPAASTGRDGDFYLDTNANTIYGPRNAGAWPAGTSLVGPQGVQGTQGNPGTAGSDGANGKSAYELAVTQGYSGTLSQWIASLQGAQGPAGVVAAGTHGDVTVAADSTFTVLRAGTLTTARNINGVAFDGSADITINAVDATPRIASSLIGAANGIAPLGADSRISATYLPSYVDDVLEFTNLAAFPANGETGKIYIADDTNFEYRWTGTQYIRIVASPGTTDALAEGTSNLYFTTARAIAALANATIAGTLTTTGQIFAQSNVIVGTNTGLGNYVYFNSASGHLRGIGFQTAGAYAGDISLLADNTTIAFKSVGIHSFQISGTETFQVNGTGATVTGALAVSGNLTVNGGKQVAGIGSDGGMEVGTYVDFHSPTADGVDFRARISTDAAGTLYIDPTIDIVNVWATQLFLGGGTQNLMLRHDGSNGYVQTQTGKGDLFLGANGGNRAQITAAGDILNLTNGRGFSWTDVSGTRPNLVCQSDNNLVLYGTSSTGAARPIMGIIMRSDTSGLGINVDVTAGSGNLYVRGTTMMALTHDGSNGFIQAKTGMLVLGANGNNSIWCNTDGSVTTGVSWFASNTWNFTATNAMVLKNGTASNPSIIFRNDGTNFYILKTAPSTAPSGAWDTTRPFTIDLGTGNISMSQSLTVSSTLYVTLDIYGHDIVADRGDATGIIYFGNRTNGHYCYWDGTYYHFNNGAVHVNGLLTVDSSISAAGNITYTSDARKKSNIRILDDASAVLSLNAYRFEKDGREEIGFIAQQVEKHIPEAVHTDKDGWKSLNDVPILAQLVEQVKALTAEVERLKAAA